jgi:hypothetical protein
MSSDEEKYIFSFAGASDQTVGRRSGRLSVASVKARLIEVPGFDVRIEVHVHQHQTNFKETCKSGSLHCPAASTNRINHPQQQCL